MSSLERTPGPHSYSNPATDKITAALGSLAGLGAGALYDNSPGVQAKNMALIDDFVGKLDDKVFSSPRNTLKLVGKLGVLNSRLNKGKLLGLLGGGLLGLGAGKTVGYYQDLGANAANKLHNTFQASKSAKAYPQRGWASKGKDMSKKRTKSATQDFSQTQIKDLVPTALSAVAGAELGHMLDQNYSPNLRHILDTGRATPLAQWAETAPKLERQMRYALNPLRMYKGKLLGAGAAGLLGFLATTGQKSAQEDLRAAVRKELEKRAHVRARLAVTKIRQKSAAVAGTIGGLTSIYDTGSVGGGLLGGLSSEVGGGLGALAGGALASRITGASKMRPLLMKLYKKLGIQGHGRGAKRPIHFGDSLLMQLGAGAGYGAGGYGGYRLAKGQMKPTEQKLPATQKTAAIAGTLGGLASAANTGSLLGGAMGGLASETGGLLGGAAGAALAPALGSALGANPKTQQLLQQLGALTGYGLGGYGGYRLAKSQMKDRQTREAGL